MTAFLPLRGGNLVLRLCAGIALIAAASLPGLAAETPRPLLRGNTPVDWWFVFKFNSTKFSGCGPDAERTCQFGGRVQLSRYPFGQQFVSASKADGKLTQGKGCAGATDSDPLGATFGQIYNGSSNFIIWNDQFNGDPLVCGKSHDCASPWGHSKGMLAWDDSGEGLIMQVTTPSWPGAGSKRKPRKVTSGNTLGCVKKNNVKFSQHFFALKLTKPDLVTVLKALANASVATDPFNPQIARNGGPQDIRDLVEQLGQKSKSETVTKDRLSTGVTLISKPSKLHVPPWQLASALLDQESNRSATWWASPRITSTNKRTPVSCWPSDGSLKKPGASLIVRSGQWRGTEFKMISGSNHAKIGVTTSGDQHYTILSDLNQQGRLTPPKCDSSQNGRGGLFFVLDDKKLFDSMSELLDGDAVDVGDVK